MTGIRGTSGRPPALLGALKGKLVDASGTVEHPATMQAATWSPRWRLSNVASVHVYEVVDG